MIHIKKILTVNSLSIIAMIIFTACDPGEDPENLYDAETINKHLETDVTFDEPYRPQFHYSPRINWMNDPNGLVYYDGQYHLFHQYNPFGDQWGYMSWAHAVSEDLVHWEHQPVAIPYGNEQDEGIFSGSAVVDYENTSGFGDAENPPFVAIYTSAYGGEEPNQAQSLAYSNDGGETFIKYEGNPVLDHEDPDFRDPNVWWDENEQRWLMLVALPIQHKVQFYASKNLIDWEHLSDFGPAGSTNGKWECPALFELPIDGNSNNKKWVLQVDFNPGAIAGGSGSQYFVGDFDGERFTEDSKMRGDNILWTDYGPDFYAAIPWNNIPGEDGRTLWIGWMSNWNYANEEPTSPWRTAQSIPRSLSLRTVNDTVRLIQEPIEELKTLRISHINLQNIEAVDETLSLTNEEVKGRSFELIADLDLGDAETAGFRVRVGENQETLIGYDAKSESVFVDRSNSGEDNFNEGFAQRSSAPVDVDNGKIRLHIFVDRSSVEVFVNNGNRVLTARIFPDQESQDVEFYAEGRKAELLNLDFWLMNSIW